MTLERAQRPDHERSPEPAQAPAPLGGGEPADRTHLDRLWQTGTTGAAPAATALESKPGAPVGKRGAGPERSRPRRTANDEAAEEFAAPAAIVLRDDEVRPYLAARIAAIRADVQRLGMMAPGETARALAEKIDGMFDQISEALDQASPAARADFAIATLEQEQQALYADAVHVLSKHIKISTGIPSVDHRRCEQEGEDRRGCFLTPNDRNHLMDALSVVVGTSMANYRTAISNVRFDTLTKTEDGWGFLAEFLFAMASGGLLGVAMKGLARFKGAVAMGKDLDDVITSISNEYRPPKRMLHQLASVSDAAVKDALVTSSKGLRTTLKSSFRGLAPDARGDAAFLDLLVGNLKPIQDDLLTVAPAALNDLELVALHNAYKDRTTHAVGAYQAVVEDMVMRYRGSHVSEIGTGRSNGVDYMGKKEAVMVKAGRHTRMAIVEYFDPKYAGAQRIKLHDGKLVPWETPEFVAWVDDDFRDLSRDLMKERFHRSSRLVDATNRTSGFRQFDDWANQVGAPIVTPIDESTTTVSRRQE